MDTPFHFRVKFDIVKERLAKIVFSGGPYTLSMVGVGSDVEELIIPQQQEQGIDNVRTHALSLIHI